ncbi:MAG: flagellar brake domain-containing protein [Desulfovibrionaceae bacterium]
MMIEVGTAALLEFGLAGDRLKTVYVGAVKRRHMLFSVPLTAGIKGKAREGNRVTVRYLHKGVVFGFKSQVADFRAHPSAILFLDYPGRVEEMDIRGARRVDCFFPCTLSGRRGDVEGLIVDISTGGCRMTFEAGADSPVPHMALGSRLKADFYIFEKRNRYALRAALRHKKIEDGKLHLGLQFDAADTAFTGMVGEYVEKVARLLA